jgi:hypothetical protein
MIQLGYLEFRIAYCGIESQRMNEQKQKGFGQLLSITTAHSESEKSMRMKGLFRNPQFSNYFGFTRQSAIEIRIDLLFP